ncbi:hypothetical protein M3Y95_00997200 [Aphelenchoides besseyi]|nr:hypothetical protein M3Y95_00997200 [Aphelenchoides besseyi]
MGHDNAELLKRLRKEEANRKDLKLEVALASKMKKGGEGTLNGAGPKKGQKKGTPFPLPLGTDIICRSGDRYKIEASITQEIMVVRSKATQRLYGMKIEWLQDEKGPKQLIPPGKKVVAPSPIEEKEKHATLAVAEPKEEARSPATVEKDSSLKKRKGFKDESKSDEESKSDREAANEAEKERLRKEKEEEAARLATVEDEKAQAEIKRAKEEAAKLAAEKAQAEMEEAAKREKEEEATKLTTEDEKMQADAERDRKEKEDAQKKADAEKAQADLEREQKEKDDAAKLAELEAQKKRDEEAAAAAAAASSKEEPKAEAQPDEPAENNNFVKSTYLAPRMEQPEQPPEGASANSTYLAPTEDGAAKSTYLAPRMDQPEQQQPQ